MRNVLTVLWHVITINLTLILFGVCYLVLTVASLYAFFVAFGWWMLVFLVLSVWMCWTLSRWLIANIFEA